MADQDQLVVTCVCGWTTTGTKPEVVAATQAHGTALHNMDASEEDVLKMAQPAKGDGAS